MSRGEAAPVWASAAIASAVSGAMRPGRVFARSSVAAYAVLPDSPGQVLALLAPGAVRLPIGCVVEAGALPEPGEPIEVGEGVVHTPTHAWRPVRWWEPRPHLDPEALLANVAALRREVLAVDADRFGLPLADELAVAAALAAGDPGPALEVIGLGPGLTPSGDDVVAGALSVLALTGGIPHPIHAAIDERARSHTTALSAALLHAAGRGQMIPHAAHLVTAIAADAPRRLVRTRAEALFAVGAHTGLDLAAGMLGALGGRR